MLGAARNLRLAPVWVKPARHRIGAVCVLLVPDGGVSETLPLLAAAALWVASAELEAGPFEVGIFGGSPAPTQDRWMDRPDYYEREPAALDAAARGITG